MCMIFELLKVFFISLLTDLDNIIIYLYILKRKPTLYIAMFLCSILAINRTVYISFVHSLNNLPGIDILIGTIILIIAINMSTKQIDFDRQLPSIFKVFGAVILLDLFLSFDGIVLIADISETYLIILIGIACSLLVLFIFSTLIFKLISFFPWIYIIAASFIAFTGVKSILTDVFIIQYVESLNNAVSSIDTNNWLSITVGGIIFINGMRSWIINNKIVRA
ncbi:TerC family protein [Litchfieldia alkalitelluris]|uniref:Uncharacterized protein n=2 Tax=Evansella alkalicola TaxID=745819 RepID=A0ABS6JUB7_9BACI|nr:hypothetical protein [Litchfieldia alkalitelluris]MBU9722088.1 hypothetical protein [Bacillus alkalicola]